MTDLNPMGADSTIFQLRASRDERSLSTAGATVQRNSDSDADLEHASEQFESLLLNLHDSRNAGDRS